MSHTVRVENTSPLLRAVRLVERVSRTRDSHMFGEGVEFRIRQKWILLCALFVVGMATMLLWMICLFDRGRRKVKVE